MDRLVKEGSLDHGADCLGSKLVLLALSAISRHELRNARKLKACKAVDSGRCIDIIRKRGHFSKECLVGGGWGKERVQDAWDALGG